MNIQEEKEACYASLVKQAKEMSPDIFRVALERAGVVGDDGMLTETYRRKDGKVALQRHQYYPED